MKKEERIKILQDMIKINSVGGNEAEVATYIENLFKAHGISSERVTYSEGRDNLITEVSYGTPGKTLGLTGHMDVVPVGAATWEHDPFSGDIVGDKLYGRGASDMKSGLAAMVIAIIELKDEGKLNQGSIKLISTVGEETSAIGAEQLTEKGYADNLDGLIIGEPSNFAIAVKHQGALWPRITTYGHTAHGSMPEKGVNAIDHMLLLVDKFRKAINFKDYKDELIGTASSSLDIFQGGEATNEVPDKCVVEFDIRTVPSLDHAFIKSTISDIIAELTKTVPDFHADVEYINDLLGIDTDMNDPLVKLVHDVATESLGKEVPVMGSTGYTDGSKFVLSSKKFPILVFGPGLPTQAHQPNEYCSVNDYLHIIDMYKEIAISFLSK